MKKLKTRHMAVNSTASRSHSAPATNRHRNVRSHSFSVLVCTSVLALTSITADTAQADFDAGKRAFDAKYFDKARSEWSKSATEGDPQSQFHLGQLFDTGTGVRENNTQAYFWYALASLGGSEQAKAQLATLKSEMSAEEIERAKDLTSRFERVFAPVRYITSEPESNLEEPDATAQDTDSNPVANDSDTDTGTKAAETETVAEPEAVQPSDNSVAAVQEQPEQELDDASRIERIREKIQTSKDEPTASESKTDTETQSEQPQLEAAEVTVITVASDQQPTSVEESSEESTVTAALPSDRGTVNSADNSNKATPVENRGVLTETASKDPSTHLQERMRSLIREVQTMLNELGYTAGPADGVIGKKTRQAVVRFQKENGLPDNGELGPRTIRALRLRS